MVAGRHEKRCKPPNIFCGQFGEKIRTFWIKTPSCKDVDLLQNGCIAKIADPVNFQESVMVVLTSLCGESGIWLVYLW